MIYPSTNEVRVNGGGTGRTKLLEIFFYIRLLLPTKKLRGAAAFCRVPLERVVGPSIDASIKYGQNLVKHVI